MGARTSTRRPAHACACMHRAWTQPGTQRKQKAQPSSGRQTHTPPASRQREPWVQGLANAGLRARLSSSGAGETRSQTEGRWAQRGAGGHTGSTLPLARTLQPVPWPEPEPQPRSGPSHPQLTLREGDAIAPGASPVSPLLQRRLRGGKRSLDNPTVADSWVGVKAGAALGARAHAARLNNPVGARADDTGAEHDLVPCRALGCGGHAALRQCPPMPATAPSPWHMPIPPNMACLAPAPASGLTCPARCASILQMGPRSPASPSAWRTEPARPPNGSSAPRAPDRASPAARRRAARGASK